MATNTMSTLQIFQSHPLFHFLHQHPCANGKDATITGMGELTGRWHIPDSDYPQFLDLLNDYLFVKKHRPLGFVEQPRLNQPKPLLIDLDFHYPKTQALERRFTEENIRDFCVRISQAYQHFFDISVYDTMRFFVTLRPQPYADKDKIKDGIHILCPDAPLSNEKWNVLRKYLLSQNIIREIFGHTAYQNKDEDVFDPSMGRKQGWMFYGASKPSIPAYKLTNVMVYAPESEYWEDESITNYTNRQLLGLMSVRYGVEDDINTVKEESVSEFNAILNPPQTRYEELDEAVVNRAATVTALQDPLMNALVAIGGAPADDATLLRALVMDCLASDRAEGHDDWMRVGWCLHNIAKTEDMFQLWMDFSQAKAPTKWADHRAREIPNLRRDWFMNMRMDGDGPRLNRRSLYKWARDDNPERYNQIIEADVCEYIIHNTDATHYHIAQLMKKVWNSLYVASVDSRATDWLFYDEQLNMWRILNQGMELRLKICTDVAKFIESAASKERQRLGTATGDDRERHMKKMTELMEMQKKLYSTGFNESVMKMCATLFYEEDFVNKLNTDPFLFGCANGVLELRHKVPTIQAGATIGTQEATRFGALVNQQAPTRNNPVLQSQLFKEKVIFRQGRPEDYVSFLAGKNHPETDPINYIPYSEYVKNKDPRLEEIQDFFKKLFPRDDLRKHILKLLASCLEGMNREQLYYFFIGVGSNGKSKLVTLMRLVFGDYQTSLQATVFTRKRPESGAANPDIMAIKCRRFIYSQEPDHQEPLNTSRMKQMSGEDIIEARGLFRDQEKFKVMGKMFMMCNRLPPINSMDNGTWRRIRVIPFESRFEEPDHPDLIAKKPNFYPRDNSLDEKLMTWREPFLSYLVHLYETEYMVQGLQPEPAVIKQESDRYKADYDAFAKFCSERIRKYDKDKYPELLNDKFTVKEILKAYNKWIITSAGKKMELRELEHRCDEVFGDSRGTGVYRGIRVFLDEDDLEEFDRQHEENEEES
jgi:P4 family phage/plasmid primase-like protien